MTDQYWQEFANVLYDKCCKYLLDVQEIHTTPRNAKLPRQDKLYKIGHRTYLFGRDGDDYTWLCIETAQHGCGSLKDVVKLVTRSTFKVWSQSQISRLKTASLCQTVTKISAFVFSVGMVAWTFGN